MNQLTPYQSNQITVPLDLASHVPEWTNELRKRVAAQEISQDTADGYKRGALMFLTWLRSETPTPDIIRDWKTELLTKYKPAAINAWLAGTRSFFVYLAERAYIPFNPTQNIPGATRKGTSKRHRREQLTNTEVRAVLTQPDRSTAAGKRDYAILATMLYTAARTIEVHRADLSDLRTENNKLVLYVQGKGRTEKDELLVITGPAETAIMEWLAERGTHPGALFVSLSDRSDGERLSRRSIRQIVKGYFTAAGVHGNKTTHSLRHTAITSAIRAGGDPLKVKAMSRHSSVDTLMIYYHEVDRIDHPAEELITYEE